jgi:hypothetical protein
VLVVPHVHPPVLGRNERAAEHQAADDCGRQRVSAGRLAAHECPVAGPDVVCGVSQRPAEIDEHVQPEQQKPDHRRRAMEPARDLECGSVEKPHRDSAAEENDGRHDEERREQAHRRLWRPVSHIGPTARVVPGEAPAGGRQLQNDQWDQREPDEDVPRHERVHAEQNGCDLDEDRSEQKHTDCRRQALVSVGVHLLSLRIHSHDLYRSRGPVNGP